MMQSSIEEHDGVALLRNLPEEDLLAGDTGVVVYLYADGTGCEVEFANPGGKPEFRVVTVELKDLLRLQPRTRIRRAG